MDKALNLLALAHKAGRVELGEEPAGAAARANHARLMIVASDASDHTWRRAKSFVSGTDQPCLRVPFTKDQAGMMVGRTSLAIAAFTDPSLALAFVKALGDPEKYGSVLADLQERSDRARKHEKEQKAHLKNKKMHRAHPARSAGTKKEH